MEVREAIETSIGVLRGRDAIFLDSVHYERPNLQVPQPRLQIRGEFNGNLASRGHGRVFYAYSIQFSGVLAFNCVELDSWSDEGEYVSSFQEVINSSWHSKLGGKVNSSHKHFQFITYDDVIDIICSGYELEIQPLQPDPVPPGGGY